jgi:alanine dehydrogenase
MIVGVPKEILNREFRVALTPAGAQMLAMRGHEVIVEAGAGAGSGFSDAEYEAAGARIVPSAERVWSEAQLILKVKEPQPEEYGRFRRGQILFAYLHLAAVPALAHALASEGVTAIAYETVRLPDGRLPLLTPMSEIAGRMAVQAGARFLEAYNGGRGVLLGGVPGVPPGEVIIVGGGTAGASAADVAVGMGANVTILEKNVERMRELERQFRGRARTVASNPHNVAEAVRRADLLIGAVLLPGAPAPRVVSEEMVRSMKPGAVIVDIAVDQGGCVETIDRATTHENPVYVKHGVIHYAVANIPGAVPRTATLALTQATIDYVLELADGGLERALVNPALAAGLNIHGGVAAHPRVAEAVNLPYVPPDRLPLTT